ncbi:drug resistance transporter, EmrB/QacA subfamily [Thermobaculum terrenum ATCC BAA-798]|uniref:Drug resistance transporter, EmrB/QacA subfamily n=1 Tax=Thermobaculum terrenum (strain ATCC BAA-798 / CCMEE 7001 / YNP1) TaxID=525904 RepID=D1CIC9_THET1|nr:MDR family MFS transporter [Thermobaculum terrenum]ACZ43500.1 drug resistance transporter, EmrB/QacA subfamily [Thermobaculum terrenum ATCC BAA-798]
MAQTTVAAPKATSLSELPRRQVYLTLAGLLLAMLLSALDQTVVGTAMPRVIAELRGFNHYAWVFTAYMVTSTTMVPIFGKLSDIYGRKWFYLGGVALFLVASWLCGLSQTMTQLILFRGLQGVGAGVMQAIAFTVVGDLFPPAERGKIQGVFSAVFGLASIVGPTLGGWITDNLNWRWVFYVNVPIGVLALGTLFLFFPNIRPHGHERSIDYWGVLALIFGVVPMLIAFSWAGTEYPWGSSRIIGLLAFSAVMILGFIWLETRAQEPVIPLSLFRNRTFTVSVISTFITSAGMFGAIMYIPLFVQGVIGTSATSSGTILMPMMFALIFSSIVSGQIISRTGKYKVITIVGLLVMTGGLYLLSRMDASATNALVVRNMVITGLGLGVTMPVFTMAVQNALPYKMLGVGTSSLQFFRAIGGTIGVAIYGSLLNNRFQDALQTNLPRQLTQIVPADRLKALDNPQVLVSPEARQAMQRAFAQLGPQGEAILRQLMESIKVSLSSAITGIFLVAAVAVLVSTVVTLFLPELPLRRSHQAAPVVETGEFYYSDEEEEEERPKRSPSYEVS